MSKKQFRCIKAQLNDDDIHWQFNVESNSIAIIVKHIVGNMLSRWTNFLTEDGEKEWRQRDNEFEDTYTSKSDMITDWEKGWQCLFDAIKPLNEKDLEIEKYSKTRLVTEMQKQGLIEISSKGFRLTALGKWYVGN